MHVEPRGPNNILYVYLSRRNANGDPENIYIGKLDEVLAGFRHRNGFTPTVGITQYGKEADISVSIHDYSSKAVMGNIRVAIQESENKRQDPAKRKRNEAILMARSMAKDGIKYDGIARQLSKLMGHEIKRGTAHKWANTAKLSKDYYEPSQDFDKILLEKRIAREIEHDRE